MRSDRHWYSCLLALVHVKGSHMLATIVSGVQVHAQHAHTKQDTSRTERPRTGK